MSNILGARNASELLSKAGFVGIEYPAQYRSGGRSDGAKNYVIFNEKDIKIVSKTKLFRTANGDVYGFVRDGKIYLDPKLASSETAVHEYTHLWSEALRKNNPKAWEKLKSELLKDKETMGVVKKLYPELEGDALMDEVFSNFSGKCGAEKLRTEQERLMNEAKDESEKSRIAKVFDRIKRALDKYWNMARDLMAGKTKGIEKLSAEDFADMALNGLLRGEKPDAEGKQMRENRATRYEEMARGYETSSRNTGQRYRLEEDKKPTFYSNAERAVEGIKQNKATAEQWKAMLTKAGGIKAGEDKWMGLSAWLDENKGKSLTKDEVLQFVKDNGIQMEETTYSEAPQSFDSLKREYDQWLHEKGITKWILDKKMLYSDKERALDFLNNTAPIAGTERSQELDNVAKIIKDFQNPSDLVRENTINEIREAVEALNGVTGGRAKVVREAELGKDVPKNAQAWYDPNTGEVHVVAERVNGAEDASRAVWHEEIGHKAMSEDKINCFLGGGVWGSI